MRVSRVVNEHASASVAPPGPHAGDGKPFLKIEQEIRFIFLSVKKKKLTTIVSDILHSSQLCNLKRVFFSFYTEHIQIIIFCIDRLSNRNNDKYMKVYAIYKNKLYAYTIYINVFLFFFFCSPYLKKCVL